MTGYAVRHSKIKYYRIYSQFLAEIQCCDGSDERPGVCPNLCKEIGEAYEKKHEAEIKIQREVC
jgi:hypothetical protein